MKRAFLICALAACSSKEAEPSGVANWDVTKTTVKDATGRCDKTDLPDGRRGTWCFMQPPLSLGGQKADVDLYFGGEGPDAKLIEIQLKLNVCDTEKLDAWARTSFGQPAERKGARAMWKNRYLYALVIADGGHCMVRVLPLSEEKEAQRIFTAP
ncbi:MAG TPA: hypothetical protein VL463_08535 [Kofleriaceae bacterium]|nr:hypothetical protein [Kofleriaceae bacterium]